MTVPGRPVIATNEGRELLGLYGAASGEPDLAKHYALRALIAGILGRMLSAVRIKAATRTGTTWAADGIKTERDHFQTLIAACGHVELWDDEPDRPNPAWRVGILITPPADIVAQHQAVADGWPLAPLLSMPLRPA